MADRDLTDIVETVCASEWKRQKYAHGQQWDDLDSLVQHNAREALLPIIQATLAAIDGHDHTISEAATRRAVTILDDLDTSDPEAAHNTVDELLLDLVPDPISEAVERVVRRADWWAGA